MDSSSNNIVEIDNFITHEECELLIDYFKKVAKSEKSTAKTIWNEQGLEGLMEYFEDI